MIDDLDWGRTSWPDRHLALEAVTVVKALDPDGEVCLITRYSRGLAAWEVLGMATVAADDLRRQCQLAEEDDD